MKFAHLSIELITGFFLLFFIVKIVGRKIINRLTPFTYIAGIVFGEILGNALYEDRINTFYIVYSMCLWGLLLFTVEFLGQKLLFFRGIFEGKPIALIKNGAVDKEALKKARLNINQLQSLLRERETFSVREVAFCFLEANGKISILKKAKYQKTTVEDFNLPEKPIFVPVTLIRDGKVLWDEIQDLGFNEEWLRNQLQSQNVTDYKDIFLAEWQEDDGIFVQTY
ncbi:YetF domain-containing protein [Bacillus sp. 1P02SD]|uniref:YetF domain-containing protein n=1 Tax=Bacillus sp. 1P02SD TaxID=3132264 RepID=UPI0039A0E253